MINNFMYQLGRFCMMIVYGFFMCFTFVVGLLFSLYTIITKGWDYYKVKVNEFNEEYNRRHMK